MNIGIFDSFFGDSSALRDAIVSELIIIDRILFTVDLTVVGGEGSTSISTSTITANSTVVRNERKLFQ